jgi:hypothetical protein
MKISFRGAHIVASALRINRFSVVRGTRLAMGRTVIKRRSQYKWMSVNSKTHTIIDVFKHVYIEIFGT